MTTTTTQTTQDAAQDVSATTTADAPIATTRSAARADQYDTLSRPDVVITGGEASPFASLHSFVTAQRMAFALSQSTLIPPAYRQWVENNGKWEENPSAISNCMIAIDLAARLRIASPLLVMQQVDIIHGRPALRGTMMLGLINSSGEFSPVSFEVSADDGHENDPAHPSYRVRAYATRLNDGHLCTGPWITWAMVADDGWLSRKGSKWKTMPELMFLYRAAAFWGRVFAPHIMLGLQESDEVRDTLGYEEPEHAARPRGSRAAELNALTDDPAPTTLQLPNAETDADVPPFPVADADEKGAEDAAATTRRAKIRRGRAPAKATSEPAPDDSADSAHLAEDSAPAVTDTADADAQPTTTADPAPAASMPFILE